MINISNLIKNSEVLKNVPYLWLVTILIELEDMGLIKKDFEVKNDV